MSVCISLIWVSSHSVCSKDGTTGNVPSALCIAFLVQAGFKQWEYPMPFTTVIALLLLYTNIYLPIASLQIVTPNRESPFPAVVVSPACGLIEAIFLPSCLQTLAPVDILSKLSEKVSNIFG